MMADKYRVHELAKDLNVPAKDISDFLDQALEGQKKHMTALDEIELNLVFEHFTQQKQVENFEEYFAMVDENKQTLKADSQPEATPKAKEPRKEKKVSAEEGVKSAPQPQQPVVEKSAAPVTQVKAETPPTEAPAKVDSPRAVTEGKTEVSTPATAPSKTEAPRQGFVGKPEAPRQGFAPKQDAPRPAGGFAPRQDGPRPAGGFAPRPDGPRPAGGFAPRQDGPRPAGGYPPRQDGPRPAGGFAPRPDGPRPAGGYPPRQDGPRPAGGFAPRPDGPRPAGGFAPRQDGPRPAGGGYAPRPAGGGYAPRPGGQRPPFGKDKDETSGRSPIRHAPKTPLPKRTPNPDLDLSGTTVVDMRAAHVDLDKYNERYEQIAPTAAKNIDAVKKQKLTQRSSRKGKPMLSRKEQEAEKLRRLELERQRRQKLEITIPEEITVGDLAAKLKVQSSELIKRLMPLGIMASVSQVIDYDTASLVAMEIGAKVSPEVIVTIEDRLFVEAPDSDDNLKSRSPIVVVMGHVDHGKTSLLDAIRKTNVTTGEAGGITQHIGAYQVEIKNRKITFLDTPGHEAFTSMRARGAQVTDVAIVVVAADDGIMPQTIEAINHAKAAGVSIIVAINKMDKPAANPEKVKQELTEHGLVPEEWGGDVICVPVSAKAGTNLDTLLEMVQLVSDMLELRANPDRLAQGTVIEANLDKGKGPIATLLVQNGTLHVGDVIIAGTALGRVRVMTDDRGNRIEEAGPSMPVSITGLDTVPSAGDIFNSVEDERLARELVDKRKHDAREEQFKSYQKVTLDNLFEHISDGDMKELPIIIKADVQGSVEAVKQSLEKISNEEVRVKVIHGAVGAVSESDVMLAAASNAIIVGFNVRPDPIARENAERDDVDIRLYRIIYDAIEEIESAMKGMLAPKFRDVELGRAEIRSVYKITNVGVVAGCYVTEGKITRNAKIRVVRGGIIIADDKLSSLKRFKDDAKEVARGFECGMTLEKYKDIKEGDFFEAYEVEEYRD